MRGNGGGQPTKLTPEREAAILDSISRHVPYAVAALANGIHPDTLYEWLNRAKRDMKEQKITIYTKFSESLNKIEQDFMDKLTSEINSCCKNWQAKAWILERRHWKHYSQNAAVIEFNRRLDEMEANQKGNNDYAKVKLEIPKKDA